MTLLDWLEVTAFILAASVMALLLLSALIGGQPHDG